MTAPLSDLENNVQHVLEGSKHKARRGKASLKFSNPHVAKHLESLQAVTEAEVQERLHASDRLFEHAKKLLEEVNQTSRRKNTTTTSNTSTSAAASAAAASEALETASTG